MESIISILEDNLGLSFTIGVCLIGFVMFFVWWARGVWDKVRKLPCDAHKQEINSHKEDIVKYNNNLITLPCESHKELIGSHKKILEEQCNKERLHHDEITKISTSLNFIKQTLDNLGGSRKVNDPFTQTNSPLQITDKGQEVAEQLKLEEAVSKGWNDISTYISESVKKMNAYDIQQFCVEQTAVYPEKFFIDQNDLDRVKLHAYNEGLTLLPYMRIAAVMIRDRYFAENNIPLEHIDENNPNIDN